MVSSRMNLKFRLFRAYGNLALFLPIALCAGLAGCVGRGAPDTTQATAEEVPTVPVAKATRTTLTGELVLTAEFEPFQEVDVMSKVAGYVHSIRCRYRRSGEGRSGSGHLEIPEMEDELAKAAATIQQDRRRSKHRIGPIRQAESTHELAHLSYGRMQEVAKREPGLVPQQQVDEFRSRDLVAEAQVAAAKSNLLNGRTTNLAWRAPKRPGCRPCIKYTTITAPFAGVVTKRYANIGSMIQAGTPRRARRCRWCGFHKIICCDWFCRCRNRLFRGSGIGGRVEVKVPSLAKTFPGRVARVSDKVQALHAHHGYASGCGRTPA